jgi:hypothetical protein
MVSKFSENRFKQVLVPPAPLPSLSGGTMNFFCHNCRTRSLLQAGRRCPGSRQLRDGPEIKMGSLQTDGGSEKILELFLPQDLEIIEVVRKRARHHPIPHQMRISGATPSLACLSSDPETVMAKFFQCRRTLSSGFAKHGRCFGIISMLS